MPPRRAPFRVQLQSNGGREHHRDSKHVCITETLARAIQWRDARQVIVAYRGAVEGVVDPREVAPHNALYIISSSSSSRTNDVIRQRTYNHDAEKIPFQPVVVVRLGDAAQQVVRA